MGQRMWQGGGGYFTQNTQGREQISCVVRSCCWKTLENIVKRREHLNVNRDTW